MQYRRLGETGLRVSAIGLGTNSFGLRVDARRARAILEAAVDTGITLIDTANVYAHGQSEAIIGEALATTLRTRRDDLILATKAGMPVGDGPNDRGGSRRHLLREVDRSLSRLRVDHIDLFQVHTFDPETPLEETLCALDALVRAGKVRYVGCSNYRAWETVKALWVSDRLGLVRYQSVQLSYSLADRGVEREVLPLARDQGLGFLAYYPLAGGILTGKYEGGAVPPGSRAAVTPWLREKLQPEYLELGRSVAAVARELGAAAAQVALAWLLTREEVSSVVVGASSPEEVRENQAAAELHLPEEARAKLERASEPFLWGRPFAEYRL
jgi:aryl-alcohol dehydrogenase-like predicted oxidoreductase